jgi:hypothetical protein
VYPSYEPTHGAGPFLQAIEYRSAPRYRVLQRCHIRPPGVAPGDGWRAIVFSISATGMAVTLPISLERGTEVDIEPWNLPGTTPVRAKIVHTSRLESVWLLGCELFQRLSDEELAAWLMTATPGS